MKGDRAWIGSAPAQLRAEPVEDLAGGEARRASPGRRALLLAPLCAALGCGSDGGGKGADGSGGADSGDNDTSGDTDDSGDDGRGDSGDDAGGVDGLHAAASLNFYPPDPLVPDTIVGVAGGFRLEPLEGLHDPFATVALGLSFPPPPDTPDTVAREGIPLPFDWGRSGDWALAGDGLAFASEAGRLAGCLSWLGINGDYPLYLSAAAPEEPANEDPCAADPGRFGPGLPLQLDLFGGERFETEALAGLWTPQAFEVSAPAMDELDFAIDPNADLELRWSPPQIDPEGGSGPEFRMVARIWDTNGIMITAHAIDDGAFDIPAADLGTLTPGPVTITLAREHVERREFSGGIIDIGVRYERWGYGAIAQ